MLDFMFSFLMNLYLVVWQHWIVRCRVKGKSFGWVFLVQFLMFGLILRKICGSEAFEDASLFRGANSGTFKLNLIWNLFQKLLKMDIKSWMEVLNYEKTLSMNSKIVWESRILFFLERPSWNSPFTP